MPLGFVFITEHFKEQDNRISAYLFNPRHIHRRNIRSNRPGSSGHLQGYQGIQLRGRGISGAGGMHGHIPGELSTPLVAGLDVGPGDDGICRLGIALRIDEPV